MIDFNLTEQDVRNSAAHFAVEGEIVHVEECCNGHINRTYFLTYKNGEQTKRYVMQMINTDIFKKPDEVMENIVGVTEHIRKGYVEKGIDPTRRALNVIWTKSGKWGHVDRRGTYWRMYDFVEDSDCFMAVESAEMFEKVAYAFGQFQMQLKDFDASKLHESIPNFHNTEWRFDNLLTAIKENRSGRAHLIPDDIKFALDRKHITSYINKGIANGTLSLRVTHNDTKLNNIMMDHETGEGICVIDLDTVMPGSVLADFGDSIRFGASSAAEDETDLSKVYCRLDMFEAFAKGFIEGLEGSLSESEIRALPMGAMILTYETGIRFLSDYLDGDVYFRTEYPDHNLDRARNQFKLVADMEAKMAEMDAIVEKYIK
ncbi:MAG: aminoglycoside phosphotransferase family protein [Ruminococcaceae bacterium]|nr:aminoglycoside phosphotransferase family protein [Oscillospiraceae bacterium]